MALINCKECRHQISDTAKVCPNCGAKTTYAHLLTFFKVVFYIGAPFLLFYTLCNEPSANDNYNSNNEAVIVNPAYVQDQYDFHQIRNQLNLKYLSQKNEIQMSDVFREAEYQTMDFAKKFNFTIHEWEGEIYNITTEKGGSNLFLSVISNESDFQIKYTTSSGLYGVGISINDPVYNDVRQLVEGDKVIFNGKFTLDNDDKIAELSLTESGSMSFPEFRMKFSEIKKISTEQFYQIPKDKIIESGTMTGYFIGIESGDFIHFGLKTQEGEELWFFIHHEVSQDIIKKYRSENLKGKKIQIEWEQVETYLEGPNINETINRITKVTEIN